MLSRLKIPKNNYSITAPGAHILLVFDDDWMFDTPKTNNHGVTAQSPLIVFDDDSTQSLNQVPIFC